MFTSEPSGAAQAGAVSLLALLAALPISASNAAEGKHSGAAGVPRTADGHPDLQGIWTAGSATPFERPDDLTAGATLTQAQAATLEQRAADFRSHKSTKPGDVGHDNEAFLDVYNVLPTMQTSLVVVPADGKVQLTPEAERRRDFNLNNYDSFESMSPWDRCITRGPASLVPAAYNNGYEIVQTPKSVVIMTEMIHEARVIPTDGSPHADSRIRSWAGDSRGHWEGETLVVDTTNFNGKGWITTHVGTGRVRGVPYSEDLHIVERFTRTDANTIHYEITIEDPSMYRSPWTVSFPMTRDDSYTIYEYACHEGNTATESILRGARMQEQKADATASSKE
jgi:hypothetical protein